ncbi:MAG: ribonucleoside-diphosphate reductase, partial [Synergistaceae bacterium]|nr:ribonucleoside-diphosphate reductase [Synergistaceae bacterium]
MGRQDIKTYFNTEIESSSLEAAEESRLSENAIWLLEQRYFVQRYDAETKSVRKERDFEEFARRVSRTVASAEVNYSDDAEWIRTVEKNIADDILNRRFLFNSPCLFSSAAGLTVI